MSTEAEIKECLESVWSEVKKTEVLENILVHSDDDPEVPEGQLSCFRVRIRLSR